MLKKNYFLCCFPVLCVFDFDSFATVEKRVTQKKSFDRTRTRKKIYSSRLPGFFSTFQSSRLMSDTACFPPRRKFAFRKKTENSAHISDLSAGVSDRFHATFRILKNSILDFSILGSELLFRVSDEIRLPFLFNFWHFLFNFFALTWQSCKGGKKDTQLFPTSAVTHVFAWQSAH